MDARARTARARPAHEIRQAESSRRPARAQRDAGGVQRYGGQRAIVFRARAREALDDVRENVRLQFARAEIIEEKQRLRAQHRDVVHAMVHQIRADGVVPVKREGELELGADAVHGRHEDRLAIFFHVQREQAAEAADLAEHLAALRAGEQLRQRGLDAIAQINVHAGGGVSFLFHAEEIKSVKSFACEKIWRNADAAQYELVYQCNDSYLGARAQWIFH